MKRLDPEIIELLKFDRLLYSLGIREIQVEMDFYSEISQQAYKLEQFTGSLLNTGGKIMCWGMTYRLK
jgi:hypothetical protein